MTTPARLTQGARYQPHDSHIVIRTERIADGPWEATAYTDHPDTPLIDLGRADTERDALLVLAGQLTQLLEDTGDDQ